MTLEEKLTAVGIVYKAGMCPSPEYYSGRGATSVDLNPQHLEKIYSLIAENYGAEPAVNFVKMVEDIPVLSATDFINSFYAFEMNNWKYEKSKVKSDTIEGILVRKNADGNYNEMHGMASMMAAIARGGRDQTESIRGPFLRKYSINRRTEFENYPFFN